MAIDVSPQNREINANHVADGRFAPGNRANPGGRPRGLAALVRAATGDGQDIVTFYLDVFTGKKRAPMRLRMEAAQWLSDRGWGKAEMIIDDKRDKPVLVVYEVSGETPHNGYSDTAAAEYTHVN